jgi:aminomethyltransferase
MTELRTTPLDGLHHELGAKMVAFAGYSMPVQYSAGVLKEHLHVRSRAGLFDVSHMGQVALRPLSGDLAAVQAALEALVPMDVLGLKPGRQRYGLFTNAAGGILDDLMFANLGDRLYLVVNAARKAADLDHLRAGLGSVAEVEPLDRALIALQGPGAEAALAPLAPEAMAMKFMDVAEIAIDGVECIVSRSGYTGEDGYEISVPEEAAVQVATRLLAQEGVLPIGLGARDSLRLEAGLCLYGHDIDEGTTPVEAALEWAIQKVRRRGGAREGGFPGAEAILGQIESGAERRRVGLRPEGRAPMRDGVEIVAEAGGEPLGRVTSGGFGPSLEAPVAMGYVPAGLAAPGTRLHGMLRGKAAPATVARMPFIEPGYRRG